MCEPISRTDFQKLSDAQLSWLAFRPSLVPLRCGIRLIVEFSCDELPIGADALRLNFNFQRKNLGAIAAILVAAIFVAFCEFVPTCILDKIFRCRQAHVAAVPGLGLGVRRVRFGRSPECHIPEVHFSKFGDGGFDLDCFGHYCEAWSASHLVRRKTVIIQNQRTAQSH